MEHSRQVSDDGSNRNTAVHPPFSPTSSEDNIQRGFEGERIPPSILYVPMNVLDVASTQNYYGNVPTSQSYTSPLGTSNQTTAPFGANSFSQTDSPISFSYWSSQSHTSSSEANPCTPTSDLQSYEYDYSSPHPNEQFSTSHSTSLESRATDIGRRLELSTLGVGCYDAPEPYFAQSVPFYTTWQAYDASLEYNDYGMQHQHFPVVAKSFPQSPGLNQHGSTWDHVSSADSGAHAETSLVTQWKDQLFDPGRAK